MAVTSFTKAGASLPTTESIVDLEVAFAGTVTSYKFASVASTALKFCSTMAFPFLE